MEIHSCIRVHACVERLVGEYLLTFHWWNAKHDPGRLDFMGGASKLGKSRDQESG